MENSRIGGARAPMAPSIKRRDPTGWAAASAAAGAAAGLAALALSWRGLPGIGAPPWDMGSQLGCWAVDASRAAGFRFAPSTSACRAAWDALPWDARAGLAGRWLFAGAAACAPGAAMWRSMMTPRDELIHARGARRLEGPEAVEAFNAAMAAEVGRGRDHDLAPGVPYSQAAYCRGVLVVGSPNCGKSTVLKPLIDKIVKADESLILFDPKSEFTASWAEPIILAPWDARSWSWDIARDMRNVGDLRRFAAAAIQESSDPMWSSASRQVLVGIGMHLNATKGDAWGWEDLARWIMAPQAELGAMLREAYPEGARAFEKATVTSSGILINLTAHCSGIFDLARAWADVPAERRFSVGDWARGVGPRQAIMQGHGSYPQLTMAFCGGIVEALAGLVASPEMEARRKLWVVCDEFPQLGRVAVPMLIETGRAVGVRVCLAFQNIDQIAEIYGDGGANSLLSMAGLLLIGRTSPGEGAERLCRIIGQREVERPNHSWAQGAEGSSSTSFARDELPVYRPSELRSRLGQKKDGTGAIFCALMGDAHELAFPRFEPPAARAASVPAPWTVKAAPSAGDAVEPLAAAASELDGIADTADAIGPADSEPIAHRREA